MSGKALVFNRDLHGSGTCPVYYNGSYSYQDDIPDLPVFEQGKLERVDNGKCPISVTGLDPTIQGNRLTEGAGKTIQVQSSTVGEGIGLALRQGYDKVWDFGAHLIDRGRHAGSTVSNGLWKTVDSVTSLWNSKSSLESGISSSDPIISEPQIASKPVDQDFGKIDAVNSRYKSIAAQGYSKNFLHVHLAIYQSRKTFHWNKFFHDCPELNDPVVIGPAVEQYLKNRFDDQKALDALYKEILPNSKVKDLDPREVVRYLQTVAHHFDKNQLDPVSVANFVTLRKVISALKIDSSQEMLDEIMEDAIWFLDRDDEVTSKHASILQKIYAQFYKTRKEILKREINMVLGGEVADEVLNEALTYFDRRDVRENSIDRDALPIQDDVIVWFYDNFDVWADIFKKDRSYYSRSMLAQAIHEVNKEQNGLFIHGKPVRDPEEFLRYVDSQFPTSVVSDLLNDRGFGITALYVDSGE